MSTLTKEDILTKLAFREIGEPYKWSGQSAIDDAGFDCSGFVYYLFESIGLLDYGKDLSANGIYNYFVDKVDEGKGWDDESIGDLAFWMNKEGEATHIEMCIGNGLCIGASGGWSATKTKADAIKHNAYVRVRPIEARKGAVILATGDLI